jgi:hypothetical protein
MPNDRDELIKDIKERTNSMSWVDIDEMVLLILSREAKMLEEIKKPLEECTKSITGMYYKAHVEEGNEFCCAIDKAIKVITRMQKEGEAV